MTAFAFESVNLITKIANVERFRKRKNKEPEQSEKLEEMLHTDNDNTGDGE